METINASVVWTHDLSFVGSADSGFTVNLSADPSVGGSNDGLRPMELLAIGLAGCTAMDVLSILKKKRQEVTGFEVKVRAERAPDHPKVFTEILVEYVVRGRGVAPEAVERAIELSETKYCPAQGMLGRVVPIQHTYRIIEESAAPAA
ncbi:MAG: OsmC family peroxiredoxin [Chloroflexi bacterium]|jgi:putative redox protein|uniref:Osmotically inducible protein OsmC n=1 Tax=Candidatus Thermofonsia Clade 3 bacterium TaxID=2364212 RepID=A0A2M8QFX9_9CHLR|nr:OsmC family protein [Candidatus Roseilinea sp. NK_OTU-006]PJF48678.1 MAG: osmotically inducible protein OsmC [Candidatus Thermofonsia Clade 3 bacterium]RMG64110.1 MAG: OsmC family peroxiredoxin [Chloroflexota bacterium]